MSGRRASGANVQAALAFAASYGAVPTTGFFSVVAADWGELGDRQDMEEDDLTGAGREPIEAGDGAINNSGTIVVPVDVRLLGLWLTLHFGAPTSVQGTPATGAITFAANPVANDTITVGGQVFTFKTTAPAANQIQIGDTLEDTLRNAIWTLNASAVAGVAAAAYWTDRDFQKINVRHKTIGAAGNSMTLAASAATVSAATLAGGGSTGPWNHVWTSGVAVLPDIALEITHPEIPTSRMNYGIVGSTGSIALQRTGTLNLSQAVVAQGEKPWTPTSQAGTPTVLAVDRFSQGSGEIRDRGVPLGEIQSGSVGWDNDLEIAEGVRPDSRIDGADAGKAKSSATFALRFKNLLYYNLARARTHLDVAFSWTNGPHSLEIRQPHLALPPRTATPVSGPRGIVQTWNGQARKHPTLGKSLIITLVNDVPGATYV